MVVSENEEIIYPGQPARQTNTLRIPTGWPKGRAADFCGQINSFGPAFYKIKTSIGACEFVARKINGLITSSGDSDADSREKPQAS